MPIGGFVVSVLPEDSKKAQDDLMSLNGLEIHGSDEKGNIIVVLDTNTSKEMEELVEKMMRMKRVLNVGLTYLNAEDELDGQKIIS